MAGLRDFVLPYVALRNKGKGYAVSIVKAGMTAIGRSAGPVRTPLTDLDAAQFAELQALIARVQDRKSTRLNSSHVKISYAVFCLKKKNPMTKHVQGEEPPVRAFFFTILSKTGSQLVPSHLYRFISVKVGAV